MRSLKEINSANAEFHGRGTSDASPPVSNNPRYQAGMKKLAGKIGSRAGTFAQKGSEGTAKRLAEEAAHTAREATGRDVSHGPNGEQQIKRGGQVVVQHDEGDELPKGAHGPADPHYAVSSTAKKGTLLGGVKSNTSSSFVKREHAERLAQVNKEIHAQAGRGETEHMVKAVRPSKRSIRPEEVGDHFPATDMSLSDVQRANDAKWGDNDQPKTKNGVHMPTKAYPYPPTVRLHNGLQSDDPIVGRHVNPKGWAALEKKHGIKHEELYNRTTRQSMVRTPGMKEFSPLK